MAILEPSPTKYFSFFVLKFGLFTKKKSFKFSNQNVFVFRSLCISKLPQVFSCGQRVSCCRQKILLNRTNFPRENYWGMPNRPWTISTTGGSWRDLQRNALRWVDETRLVQCFGFNVMPSKCQEIRDPSGHGNFCLRPTPQCHPLSKWSLIKGSWRLMIP